MIFTVGLSIREGSPTIVSATCWPSGLKPHFSTHAMDRTKMRKKLLALVLTQNTSVESAVNAALIRVAEKLYTKEHVANPLNGDPPIQVITPLRYKNYIFLYPHTPKRSHWLLTTSKRALTEWIQKHG